MSEKEKQKKIPWMLLHVCKYCKWITFERLVYESVTKHEPVGHVIVLLVASK